MHKAAQTVKSTPRTAYEGMLQDKLGRGGKQGVFSWCPLPRPHWTVGRVRAADGAVGGKRKGRGGNPLEGQSVRE